MPGRMVTPRAVAGILEIYAIPQRNHAVTELMNNHPLSIAPSSQSDSRSKDAATDSSSSSKGWYAYVPPQLRSGRRLLRYYAAVLPLAVPAAALLAAGGSYRMYGAYLTIALVVAVSASYTIWLVRKMRSDQKPHTTSSDSAALRKDRSERRTTSQRSDRLDRSEAA